MMEKEESRNSFVDTVLLTNVFWIVKYAIPKRIMNAVVGVSD